MPFQALLLLLSLIIVAACFFFLNYRKHQLGVGAQERSIDVRILNKQSMTFAAEGPHEDGMQYWIYVQPLKGGPKREFSVEPHYYDALEPGDRGTMIYQGLKFIHFKKSLNS